MKGPILIVFLLLLSFPAMAQEAPAETLRILSFNVRIWTRDRAAGSEVYWHTRMEEMARMIEDVNPDIICFQELMYPTTRYVPRGYRRVS